MKNDGKVDRLEFRLRDSIDSEQRLMKALDEGEGRHGEKGEFLMQCLMRGYLRLKHKVAGVVSEGGDTVGALQKIVADGQLDYRTVQTYLYALDALGKQEAEQPSQAAKPADQALQALSNPISRSEDPVQAALEAVAESVAAKPAEPVRAEVARPSSVQPQTNAGESISQSNQVAVETPRPANKWASMKSVAGSTGGSKKEKDGEDPSEGAAS